MILFNNLLAYIGFFGWVWVWWLNRYQTGGSKRVQIGLILIGITWVMIILAGSLQKHIPTSGTVIARAALLLGMWILTPLLKCKQTCDNYQELTVSRRVKTKTLVNEVKL